MSEIVPTGSVPCPSCGGTVSTSGTTGESEWTICPHCKHEWACPPPRSVPEPKPGRWKRFARPALFLAGLLISTMGVASVFRAIDYPAGGGISVRPVGVLALAFTVACYLAPRPWRWGGFALALVCAACWGEGSFLVGGIAALVGMLLREPTERSALSEPLDPDEVAGRRGDRAAQRRWRERRRMRRRRTLFLLSAYVVLLVPFSLGGCYLVDRRITEVKRESRQARERELDRLPGTPEYLVVLHRTPHDGCMTYADFVRDYDGTNSLDYHRRPFRVVGKAVQLRQRMLSPAELKLRDRDDRSTFDTVYFRLHDRPDLNNLLWRAPISFGETDGELVVVDGVLEDAITFGHCVVRWHGKGDDWDTAVKEAKRGLDLSRANRKSAPGGD